MRASVKKNDPGYFPDAHKHRVFLNGEFLKHCFTADEEKGLAWVHKENEHGELYIDKASGDVASELLAGKVKIIKMEG